MKMRRLRVGILALAGLGMLASAAPSRATEDDGARQAVSAPMAREEAPRGPVMPTEFLILAILFAGAVSIIVYTTVATRRRIDLRPVLGDRMRETS